MTTTSTRQFTPWIIEREPFSVRLVPLEAKADMKFPAYTHHILKHRVPNLSGYIHFGSYTWLALMPCPSCMPVDGAASPMDGGRRWWWSNWGKFKVTGICNIVCPGGGGEPHSQQTTTTQNAMNHSPMYIVPILLLYSGPVCLLCSACSPHVQLARRRMG